MAAITVRLSLPAGEREGADGNQRVVEAGHHRSHAINQLEAEPEIDEHAEHGIERGQRRLLLELVAHRGPHHVDFHSGVGVEVDCCSGLCSADSISWRPCVERSFVGLFRQADQHLVIVPRRRRSEWLRPSRLLRRWHGGWLDVGRLRKLHIHLRAASKIHAQRHRAADVRPVPSSSSRCRPR